jgi:hypothetical protein
VLGVLVASHAIVTTVVADRARIAVEARERATYDRVAAMVRARGREPEPFEAWGAAALDPRDYVVAGVLRVAALGVLLLALAWAGRRLLALALPLALVAAPLVPQPHWPLPMSSAWAPYYPYESVPRAWSAVAVELLVVILPIIVLGRSAGPRTVAVPTARVFARASLLLPGVVLLVVFQVQITAAAVVAVAAAALLVTARPSVPAITVALVAAPAVAGHAWWDDDALFSGDPASLSAAMLTLAWATAAVWVLAAPQLGAVWRQLLRPDHKPAYESA